MRGGALAMQSTTQAREPAREPAQAAARRGDPPLEWLKRRKNKDGAPFISQEAYAAGKRFASDMVKARRPGVAATDWSRPHRGGGRAGPADCAHAIDQSLAAQARLDKAIMALGGELAEVVIAACWFEVGLEAVEKELGWPARSAKTILRIALERLAEHYGLAAPPLPQQLRLWRAAGARPDLFPEELATD